MKEFWDESAAPGGTDPGAALRASEALLEEPFRPDFTDVQLNLVTMLSATEETFHGPALWYYGLFFLALGRHC